MGNRYTDFGLECSDYSKAVEYADSNALVLAIRNILLSKPGNFPFNPSIGMNIKQYQFELLDSDLIFEIQNELDKQIAACIPELEGITTIVKKLEDSNGHPYIGIYVAATNDEEEINASFLLSQDDNTREVSIFNEIF